MSMYGGQIIGADVIPWWSPSQALAPYIVFAVRQT